MPDVDLVPLQLVGHVVLTDRKTGTIILDQQNMVVDAMFELLIRGLTAEDSVSRMHAVFANGLPVTKGLRSLGSPVMNVPVEKGGDLAPIKSVDARGLRSICTWTALLQPTGAVTYDSLGLVSLTGLLCAATAFQPITLGGGDIVSVQWTISLRGA
jgi:hypothetical protein